MARARKQPRQREAALAGDRRQVDRPAGGVGRGTRLIFLSGQLAWDQDGNVVGKGDMRAQFGQV